MELLRDNKLIAIKLKNHAPLSRLIPETQWFYKEGMFYTKYSLDLVKLLKQLGVSMTGWEVIRHQYSFPLVDMQHPMYWWQIDTAAFLTTERRAFCLNMPRTGKTAAALAAIDFLISQEQTISALVITPNSCVLPVWYDQHAGLLPLRKLVPITGTKKQRLAKLGAPADIYVMNPDALSRVPDIQCLIADKVARGVINVIVLDESTEYGNAQSARWSGLKPLADKVDYFWMLTGTPGDPYAVYGQAKLMNTHSVPESASVWEAMTMYRAYSYTVGSGRQSRTIDKMLPNEEAEAHIKRVLSPAIRITRADVMAEIPEFITIPVHVELSDKQHALYTTLERDRICMVTDTSAGWSATIEVQNAAVLAGKLMQISCGTLLISNDDTDQGDRQVLRIPMQDKLDTLMRLLKETPEKKLVFANNIATVELLNEYIKEQGLSARYVNGNVTGEKRAQAFRDFMGADDPHVLVCHPRTVSYGVEAGLADAIVWFGVPTISAVLYSQANARIQSSKQTAEQPAVYQIYSTAKEKLIFDGLDAGVDWQDTVASVF